MQNIFFPQPMLMRKKRNCFHWQKAMRFLLFNAEPGAKKIWWLTFVFIIRDDFIKCGQFYNEEKCVFLGKAFVAVWRFSWVRFFHWIPNCAGMTVMRYFGIRFVLRILFLQRSQRQATQKYRKKERPNKVENCHSDGSGNPGLKLQRFFLNWLLILKKILINAISLYFEVIFCNKAQRSRVDAVT